MRGDSTGAGSDTGAVCALDSLAVVTVGGEEAQAFLQGQFSNDVDALVAATAAASGVLPSQLNAYCNPKGRALAVIRLVRAGDAFWLIVPADVAEKLAMRLRMFVLRAKVEIALRPELALAGVAAAATAAVDYPGVMRIAMPQPNDAREIWMGEKAAMASVLRAADGDGAWRLADIRAGLPQVYAATMEAFIPQMLNLDLVGGLSFSKGCYPGQEIIARLRHRGKVKQRLAAGTVRVAVATPGPGDAVVDGAGKKAGMVVDAVATGDDEWALSFTAPVGEYTGLRLGGGDGSGAEIMPFALPYSPQ